MTFDEVLTHVRGLLGQEVSIALTMTAPSGGDGWLADNAGRLARIDEPHAGVDDDVYYARFEDGSGFALPRYLFAEANWRSYGDARSLEVNFGAVQLSIGS